MFMQRVFVETSIIITVVSLQVWWALILILKLIWFFVYGQDIFNENLDHIDS